MILQRRELKKIHTRLSNASPWSGFSGSKLIGLLLSSARESFLFNVRICRTNEGFRDRCGTGKDLFTVETTAWEGPGAHNLRQTEDQNHCHVNESPAQPANSTTSESHLKSKMDAFMDLGSRFWSSSK